MRAYLDALRGQDSLPGERVMAAGDREWAGERRRGSEGMPIDAHNWQVFGDLATQHGVGPLTALLMMVQGVGVQLRAAMTLITGITKKI